MIRLGAKTRDTLGFARDIRSALIEQHQVRKKRDVADYVDAVKNLIAYTKLSQKDLQEVVAGLPFATWAVNGKKMDLFHFFF